MTDCASGPARNEPLYRLFTSVPPRYDLVNRIMTLGLDSRWRRRTARECLTHQPRTMLDLCCGTGDLAIELAKLSGGNAGLAAVDYSWPMLELAVRKAGLSAAGRNISFVCGNVAGLPFGDGCFDCVGISFAFRNLTYRNPLAERHLAEVFRVLRPGGRYVIVETSQPGCKLIRGLYRLYLRLLVFWVGYLLSGNRAAYRYLAESAARFYTPDEIAQKLKAAGFRRVSYQPLLFGAVGIHVAVR